MNQRVNAEERLVGHYSALGELKSDFRNYNLFNLVASEVSGESVVDIGCGPGNLSSILKARGKKVRGIEPSADMRELAHALNPEVVVIAGMAEDINTLVREPVDAVTMIDVLEHVEDDVAQVKKISSVLKPGGDFIFVVPSHQVLYGKRDKEMGHYRRYSKKMLKDILLANGFHVESMRYWNALGVLPYLLSEKIFHKALNPKSRHKAGIVQHVLNLWFKCIENNFDFGFGLSIIGVAKKYEI